MSPAPPAPDHTTPSKRRLPWAHALTGSRLLMAAPCAYTIVYGYWWWAAGIFTLAALSDYLDGRVARATATQSNFGGLFDHSTDAIFVAASLWALATQNLTTMLLPLLVLLAFVQYSIDSAALAGAKLRANWLGRSNGIAYFVLVGVGIGWALLNLPNAITLGLSWVLCISTLVSMANRAWYWWRHRRIIK